MALYVLAWSEAMVVAKYGSEAIYRPHQLPWFELILQCHLRNSRRVPKQEPAKKGCGGFWFCGVHD
jgi:hypothetical protein